MKHLCTYIHEAMFKKPTKGNNPVYKTGDSIKRNEFFEITGLDKQYNNTEGSKKCNTRTLYHQDLTFYNKNRNKNWISGYSIYFDGNTNEMEFPIVGVYHEQEYDSNTFNWKTKSNKAFIMYTADDIRTFAEKCMEEDNSIFTVEIEKETIQTNADDYRVTDKAAIKHVEDDRTIIWYAVGNYKSSDNYVVLRCKE